MRLNPREREREKRRWRCAGTWWNVQRTSQSLIPNWSRYDFTTGCFEIGDEHAHLPPMQLTHICGFQYAVTSWPPFPDSIASWVRSVHATIIIIDKVFTNLWREHYIIIYIHKWSSPTSPPCLVHGNSYRNVLGLWLVLHVFLKTESYMARFFFSDLWWSSKKPVRLALPAPHIEEAIFYFPSPLSNHGLR